jgi:hypothetical protein
MVWSSPAQGPRPYAPGTRRSVCIVVTPSPSTAFSVPFVFNLLRTLSEMGILQLAYYQRVPHSLKKTPGVGTPLMIRVLFSRVCALFKNQSVPDMRAARACGERSRTMRILNSPQSPNSNLSFRPEGRWFLPSWSGEISLKSLRWPILAGWFMQGWGLSIPASSRPRLRSAGEDLLHDLPPAAWLAFEDDHVAAFRGDFRARRDDG